MALPNVLRALLTVYLLTAPTSALIGFDCTSRPTNITAISLSSVTPCSTNLQDVTYQTVVVQLLQARSSDAVPLTACLVERSYVITHCGMHSHSSSTAGGFVTGEIVQVAQNECYLAHTTGQLRVGLDTVLTGLRVNSSETRPVTEMGRIDHGTHKCEGASFSIRGTTYTSAIMQSSYKITLVESWGTLDLNTGVIRTAGGYSHKFSTGRSFDADLGNIYWSTGAHTSACTKTAYLVLYEGAGTLAIAAKGGRTLMVNTSDVALAVGLTKPILLCYHHAFETDHPKLHVVVESQQGMGFYFQKSSIDPVEVDLFLYANTKLVFVERHLSKELKTVYQHFHERTCRLQHQSLQQLTTLAFIAPEEFAWLYTGRPGVTALVRGEVVYVMECPAVTVQFRQTNTCYQEIPVWDSQNNTAFLKPRSRILTPFGTELECSPLAPALFYLQGAWVSFSPNPTHVSPPKVLAAQPGEMWTYTLPPNLITAGIYAQETLLKYQQRLMFPISKEAVVNTMAARVAGVPVGTQNLDVSSLIKQGALDLIQHSFMERVYGWWWTVSVNLAGIVGLVYVLMLLRAVINLALNGTFLYRTFGCGVQLLAALCGTIAKYLLLREHLNRYAPAASVVDEEPAAETSPSLPMAQVTVPPTETETLYPRQGLCYAPATSA
nr:MAG: glycoprotein [Chuviridae sp.]